MGWNLHAFAWLACKPWVPTSAYNLITYSSLFFSNVNSESLTYKPDEAALLPSVKNCHLMVIKWLLSDFSEVSITSKWLGTIALKETSITDFFHDSLDLRFKIKWEKSVETVILWLIPGRIQKGMIDTFQRMQARQISSSFELSNQIRGLMGFLSFYFGVFFLEGCKIYII